MEPDKRAIGDPDAELSWGHVLFALFPDKVPTLPIGILNFALFNFYSCCYFFREVKNQITCFQKKIFLFLFELFFPFRLDWSLPALLASVISTDLTSVPSEQSINSCTVFKHHELDQTYHSYRNFL
jgi:hypothetical protein